MAELWISLSGVGPLHAQVYGGLREAIITGRCGGNERLPSTRALADGLGVSRTSTQTAYEQLVAEGYAVTKHGSGTFVAEGAVQARLPRPGNRERSPRAEPTLSDYASRVNAHVPSYIDIPERTSLRHDFLYGVPAPESFPREEWRRAVNAAAKGAPFDLFGSSPLGLLRLRTAIAEHLHRSRGLTCTADQVLISSGVQQGLQLAVRLLCDPGDRVLLEDPGYPGARAICASEGLRAEFVPVDDEGMNLRGATRTGLKNSRLAHVTPAHQFPTGSVLSFPRRMALLQWARQNGSFIFEDDYDSEFRYEGHPIEALSALDEDGCVVYAGSFSKTFSIELRLGFLVLPDALVDSFRRARWLAGWGNPVLEQAALALFIEEGHLERHIRRCRKRYGDRRLALVEALHAEFGDRVSIFGDRTGLHLLARFLDVPRRRSRALVDLAFKRGIGVYPVDECYAATPKSGGFLLGYGLIRQAMIREAVRELRRCVAQVAGRRRRE